MKYYARGGEQQHIPVYLREDVGGGIQVIVGAHAVLKITPNGLLWRYAGIPQDNPEGLNVNNYGQINLG